MPLQANDLQSATLTCEESLAELATLLRQHVSRVVLDDGSAYNLQNPYSLDFLFFQREDIAEVIAKRIDHPKHGSPYQEIRSFMDEAFPAGSRARRSALREALKVIADDYAKTAQ